jgi:recombination protein RecA
LFGSGIDSLGCILDAALELDIVERKGSWYAYKGKNIAQGRINCVALMKQDSDLTAALETEVRLALSEYGKPQEEVEENEEVEITTMEVEDLVLDVVEEETFE